MDPGKVVMLVFFEIRKFEVRAYDAVQRGTGRSRRSDLKLPMGSMGDDWVAPGSNLQGKMGFSAHKNMEAFRRKHCHRLLQGIAGNAFLLQNKKKVTSNSSI